ncbi:MAG: AMP-binding enzyme [Candidatus Baldrarchaeia archaeon]
MEAKLYEHPAVAECAVVGVPDPVVGEVIKAFVVLKPEYREKISEEEFLKWAREKLGPLKCPRIVEFRSYLPKTPIGKVFRRKLREEELRKLKEKK